MAIFERQVIGAGVGHPQALGEGWVVRGACSKQRAPGLGLYVRLHPRIDYFSMNAQRRGAWLLPRMYPCCSGPTCDPWLRRRRTSSSP